MTCRIVQVIDVHSDEVLRFESWGETFKRYTELDEATGGKTSSGLAWTPLGNQEPLIISHPVCCMG
jgi:hypothetical protein